MSKLLKVAARPLELLLGLVFLAGAILKAQDLNLFSVQISAYGVIENKQLLPFIALGTLTVEFLLACAFLFGIRWRLLPYAVLAALLAVFTGLIFYGWFFHDLKDCGCFGPLEISPGVSILKNLALALMGAAAAYGFALRGVFPAPRLQTRTLQTAVTVAATATMLLYGYWDLSKQQITVKKGEPGPYARFVFDLPEGHFDLGKGDYIVALLSMDCEHCAESVPLLNDLMYLPDVPPLVALCLVENEGDFETFCVTTNPLFPMYSLDNQVRLFFNLLQGADTPGIAFIRDGSLLHYWSGHAPTYEELKEALANNPKAGA